MIKGKIAYLSPFFETDSNVLLSWINDRDLVLLNAPFLPVHEVNHLGWFESIQKSKDVVIFGIRTIADDRLVGSCQLNAISDVHRSAELQIRVGDQRAQGKGIGTEACTFLLTHAFQDLNLHRVSLRVFESNQRAIRLYERLGFKVEGTLRDAAFIDGRWINVLIMAILRNGRIPNEDSVNSSI